MYVNQEKRIANAHIMFNAYKKRITDKPNFPPINRALISSVFGLTEYAMNFMENSDLNNRELAEHLHDNLYNELWFDQN